MTRLPAVSQWKDNRGFTLIELVVAIAILSLALLVALPLAGRTRAGLELRSAATEISASLRDARTAARAGNFERAVVIDAASRLMWTEGLPLRTSLPRGLGISLEVPAAERVGTSAVRLRFRPDGSASGGSVELREGGRRATVTVNWLNGDVQVRWSR